ncbi:hypothetical protein [Paenibacillus baekrokdamisoli]|uniref:hypothetical protein n=1 Tax=Paenibacillus baekrokdamisoli TaxID=1712516 RepID=UPI001C86027C|nr:hypothetical protein [Paenibacillus baekrokdamisoli]
MNNPLIYTDPSGMCVAGKDVGCYVDSFSGVDGQLNSLVQGTVARNSSMWWEIERYQAKYCDSTKCNAKWDAKQKLLVQENDGIRNNPCSYFAGGCDVGSASFILNGEKAIGVRLAVEIQEDTSSGDSWASAFGEFFLGSTAYASTPSLPPKQITPTTSIGYIEHYYRSGDHAVPHVHVIDKNGVSVRVGQNGKPISPEDDGKFNRYHAQLISTYRGVIRNNVAQIMRFYRAYPEQRK